jgi:hypothetical protein
MKAPLRKAVLLLPLSLVMACATFSPPASRSTPPANATAAPTTFAASAAAPTASATAAATATSNATSTTTASATAARAATPAATIASGPKQTRGVFIVTSHNVAIRPATYTNPAVDGIVVRTFWSNVQPTPDRFDWSFIDSQVQAAAASGKKVILVVLPGAFTPQWALQGVPTAQFVVDYGFIQGTTVTLPMPWDATYLSRWFAFVKALGQRYDSNASVVNVAADGPTYISEEMSLPDDPAAVAHWSQLGYTQSKYESAWQQTLTAYTQAFPATPIALTFYPGLPIPDASAKNATRTDLASYAFSHFGRHVTFQENGLSARKAAQSLGYDLVQQYSGQTTTGFEMGTSATQKPDQMGGPTAEAALQASVDLGLKAGVNFLEIYEPDELNPALQPILVKAHTSLAP